MHLFIAVEVKQPWTSSAQFQSCCVGGLPSACLIVLVPQSVSAIGLGGRTSKLLFAPSCELANPDTDDFRASALER